MAERVGIDPDPERSTGTDVIDPHKTVAALERMRDRLRVAARRRERVLVASGHPAGSSRCTSRSSRRCARPGARS